MVAASSWRLAATRLALLGFVGIAFAAVGSSVSGQSSPGALIASLDSAARAHIESEIIPGVSVAVVHGGETLLQRGYGYVDLEWSVPTPEGARASYEIGSITKQFTAAAIMRLVAQGRLDLEADFTDYIDFDTKGKRVSVRRLLDHTSGIKGYTEMDVFGELTPLKLPRDTLLRVIEQEAFEFEPGTAQIYNNSAYFFLGLIIEAVSGQSYEDFVAEELFARAGMEDSYYCSEAAVTDRRAHGYDAVSPERLIRARYLDHTWPYAAGSLCSTVGDLVRWNQALHGGEILSDSYYSAMVTPTPLEDGTPIRYAMGVRVGDRDGRRVIAHSGGINGFLSDARYYPDDDLIVVVLQNATGPVGPGVLSSRLVELVLGPAADPVERSFEGDLDPLFGEYSGPARGQVMRVSVTSVDGRLTIEIGDDDAVTPLYRGDLRWGMGNAFLQFIRQGERVDELRFDSGSGHYVLRRNGG